MKNVLHVQWYGKMHLLGWSDVKQLKKVKPVALAIVELLYVSLKAGRQLVSQ